MKVYNSIDDFCPISRTVVTIGTFDGVHLGHQKIIERLNRESQKLGCESLILSFLQHPRTVLNENTNVKLLSTNTEKIRLLTDLKLDNLIMHSFDKAFASLSAADFVEKILVKKFHISKIIIGHDHRFGHKRSANIDDLIVFGKKYGFEVEQISAQEIDDAAVSSTKIRSALQNGNIELANNFLGYDYSFSGIVVQGKQLGRTIGVPTANIAVDHELKLIPSTGVYVVKCVIHNQNIFGVMNIGNRPTVQGIEQTIEVHFLDFETDLYGKSLTISVLKKLRDEQKFASLDKLKAQIAIDKSRARKLFDF